MRLSFKILFPFLLILISTQTILAQVDCIEIGKLVADSKLQEAENIIKSLTDVQKNNCLYPLAEFYLRKGRNDLAEKYFKLLLTDESQHDSKEKAKALNGLGLTYWNNGDHFMAADYISQALNIRLHLSPKSKESIAASYNDLGLVSDNPDEALSYYKKALELYDELPLQEEKVAQILTNIGIIYRDKNFLGDAEDHFKATLELWKNLYPNGHPNLAFVMLNLGQTYRLMNKNDEALRYYNMALAEYEQHYSHKHPDIAYSYNLIGNLYYAQGEFQMALESYQKALIANTIHFNSSESEDNPAASDYLNPGTLLSSLFFKSQALEDYHYAFSRKPRDLHLSLSALQVCGSLIDNMRHLQMNEQDKLELSELSVQVYESGVRLCYNMAEMSLKKKELQEMAFYFSEKNKAAVLLQAISDAAAKSYAHIPASLLEVEKNFKTDIAYYEQIVASARASSSEDQNKLFELKSAYQKFIEQLEQQYPNYYNLKYNVPIPSIEKLQTDLSEESAIIAYFIGQRFNRIYTFYISKNKFEISDNAIGDSFDKQLAAFRNSIYYKDDATYQATAYSLHKTLFPFKIEKEISNLIIIPTGKLATIPFEALSTEKIKSLPIDYRTAPYLLKDYNISYQASSILFLQQKAAAPPLNHKILLCAPVNFEKFPSLPGTQREVEKIDSLLSAKDWNTTLLVKGKASEQYLKNDSLASFDIIHLATHGLTNADKPALSQILLQTDAHNDGNLYSGEIYNLKMNASLVTLSACETGLGKLSKGEGIIGLSRALTYAGAKNIMVSLWNVADNSTSLLMSEAYKNIPSQNYGRALKQAKLELINTEEYSQPYFWASFILIGQ
ncbi:CHAT domain-containing protein [Fulvivirga maritima]|uniref:CHAT domain-containing protein n=1 Tax=Fulvivirga maritima TaxID=2904247 RepID=UPI001F1F2128|nr:CHAT domain-containing tetratricopeptide repeat protein [Fulvivirga maritima]UII24932.1 CHAT domain-containing protein [Fulvivirga maritima]